PKASRLKYWDGNAFVEVKNVKGFGDAEDAKGLGVEGEKFNTTLFDEVTTTKLRLEMDSDGTNSTGIYEWKVYDSGKSPKFPPTVVAGKERSVVLGGKTYLAGNLQSLSGDAGAAGSAKVM